MATRKKSGGYLDHTPGSAIAAGEVVVIGGIVAIADADIAANTKGALALEGIYEVPCKAADDISAGDLLFWDATNGEATLTESTHKPIGYALADATTNVVLVDVKLGQFIPDTIA